MTEQNIDAPETDHEAVEVLLDKELVTEQPCQECEENRHRLQQIEQRHAKEMKDRSDCYEKEIENLSQNLRKEISEKQKQNSQLKEEKQKHKEAVVELNYLKEKYSQQTSCSSTSLVAQAVTGILGEIWYSI